jgi:hypothetical protein
VTWHSVIGQKSPFSMHIGQLACSTATGGWQPILA